MTGAPLPPFLPPHAKLLMLGSFPPPRARWKMDFYYPNLQNDMWRIFGLIFFNDKDYFINAAAQTFREAALRAFLTEQGIAIADTARRVRRLHGNAGDKFLQIEQTVDLPALLAGLPDCRYLMTTGDKATQTLLSLLPPDTPKPAVGAGVMTHCAGRALRLYRMPSSSRAYPLPLTDKARAYRQMFAEIGFQAA